ncbi:hypothetical protein BC777_1901 [Yoonia maricola]|uniref:Uncharacterized protein n=1 Tax=Yoonia maricola TaxID=420999 RepID=A0A2M8WQ46_9RHOB|nr:hypothetical protein [Yoonia maricola]PJI93034.1 hypothetical protein BC777_1901 [Yoonia maricola]
MPLLFTAFFFVTACALAGLSYMIFRIGEALSDCPATGRAARAGSLTIVTGFIAIGTGAVMIIAAGIFMTLAGINVETVLAAIGVSLLGLGLGFTHAIATLRDVVAQAAARSEAA